MGKLQELVDHTVTWVTNLYRDADDTDFTMLPTWVGVTDDKQVFFIATPYTGETYEESELTKTRSIAMVQMVFAAKNVTHYVHVSEAWIASVSKDDPHINLPVSKRDDKREVVVVIGADNEDNTAGTHMEIERKPGVGPLLTRSDIQADDFGGRMTKILDVPPMPDVLRQKINEQLDEMGIKPETFH